MVSDEVKRSDADLKFPGLNTGNATLLRMTETVVSVAAETGEGVESSDGSGEGIRGGDQNLTPRQDDILASTLSPAVQVFKKIFR